MSGPSNRDYSILDGIAKNCDAIYERLERFGIDERAFREDSALREMLLFPLIQIGELANHLSDDFVSHHGEIPWKAIVGMRNIVVHGYDTVDPAWAWETIKGDIPALLAFCKTQSGD